MRVGSFEEICITKNSNLRPKALEAYYYAIKNETIEFLWDQKLVCLFLIHKKKQIAIYKINRCIEK